VAAHSLVRALYASYSGPLYSVMRSSDYTSISISTLVAGGYAGAATQATFCAWFAHSRTPVFSTAVVVKHVIGTRGAIIIRRQWRLD
jgi:hypothetical protein